jgi:hypothetical protein
VRQALAIAATVIGVITGAGTIVGWIVSTESPLAAVGRVFGYAGMVYCLAFALVSFVGAALPTRMLKALEDEGITKATIRARALYFGAGCFFTGLFALVGTDPLDGVWIVTGLILMYLVVLVALAVGKRAAARYRTCPDCAETIKGTANVCRHCGYRFAPPPPAPDLAAADGGGDLDEVAAGVVEDRGPDRTGGERLLGEPNA